MFLEVELSENVWVRTKVLDIFIGEKGLTNAISSISKLNWAKTLYIITSQKNGTMSVP